MPKVCVCFDFGTAFSGFSYCYMENTQVAGFNQWPDSKVAYSKTKTAILYNDKTKKPIAWGHTAEKEFLSEFDKHRINKVEGPLPVTLFKMFKMAIFDESIARKLRFNSTREPISKEDLISDFLRYMYNYFLDHFKSTFQTTLAKEDIKWVLTIPAIWNDTSKKFMKKCALKAGMISSLDVDEKYFSFTLEPEAAVMYTLEQKYLKLQKNETIMIVDAGGGTIDITTHIYKGDYQFEEVAPGTGGAHGSMYVDRLFLEKFGKYIKNSELITRISIDRPELENELIAEFIKIKCAADAENTPQVLDIPTKVFKYMCTKIDDLEDNIIFKSNTEFCIEKLIEDVITPHLFNYIDSQLKYLNQKSLKLNHMVLVGGFCKSPLIRKIIEKKYVKRAFVITSLVLPEEAVVNGGSIYGRAIFKNQTVFQRKARRSYGVLTMTRFQEGVHNESFKIFHKEEKTEYADDVFDPFVKRGDLLTQEPIVKKYYPAYLKQTGVNFSLYSFEGEYQNVHYQASDKRFTLLEKFCVNISPDYRDRYSVGIEVSMDFGKEAIDIKAKNLLTGEKIESSVTISE